MKWFCGDKKEEYTKYLGKEKSWCSQYYIDPDGTYTDGESPFYNKLVNFLMAKKLMTIGSIVFITNILKIMRVLTEYG